MDIYIIIYTYIIYTVNNIYIYILYPHIIYIYVFTHQPSTSPKHATPPAAPLFNTLRGGPAGSPWSRPAPLCLVKVLVNIP